MRSPIIALSVACLALAACSGGGGGSSVPAATGSAGAPGSTGSTASNVGKAPVTITFAIPAKSTSSSARKAPQYIASTTSQVFASFSPTTSGTYVTGNGACSTSTCTLQLFVVPGTYNVLVAAEDSGAHPLSIGQSTGFTVALGAANQLSLTFAPVLARVALGGLPPTVYDGQTTSITETASLLDADGNPVPTVSGLVDQYGTAISGLALQAGSPNVTLTPATAQTITAVSQMFTFSFSGDETVNNTTISVTAETETGSPTLDHQLSTVLSPFHLAYVSPGPYNGTTSTYGDPQFNSPLIGYGEWGDAWEQSNIEYPSLSAVTQSLTLSDLNATPNLPISIDPGGCTANNTLLDSTFVAGGTSYDGSDPIVLSSYSGPISITYQSAPSTNYSCSIAIYDNVGNTYELDLSFNQNSLYVSSKKRAK